MIAIPLLFLSYEIVIIKLEAMTEFNDISNVFHTPELIPRLRGCLILAMTCVIAGTGVILS